MFRQKEEPAQPATVRSLLARLADMLAGGGQSVYDPQADGPRRHRIAFTIAVIALGAKMAKADGFVKRIEVDAFKEVFQAPPGGEAQVGRVFDLARQDVAGFEGYADQLGRLFKDDRRLLQDVLEGLLVIAVSDGHLNADEESYLGEVAGRFGFSPSEYRHIRSRFVTDDRSPYDVLRIAPDADDAAIKAQYRRLVSDNHPDRLIARGVPQKFIDIATCKLAAINEAYALIARERGIK
ncbi:MAG: DnaJ domain-containing protein [Hyphomicrobiaceae bacterium]|nr:MAG: DnaJ domain-containing protein [Hyphomicrobiaceae bacterium]